MDKIVTMVRDAAERNGRDRSSCSLQVWDLMREVGEAFGWRPRGATYVNVAKPVIESPARHNYQPGDVLDYKRVDADDASAWANSLETAKRSPHFAAMMEARLAALAPGSAVEGQLQSLIDEFVEYAYGGDFAFAISSES